MYLGCWLFWSKDRLCEWHKVGCLQDHIRTCILYLLAIYSVRSCTAQTEWICNENIHTSFKFQLERQIQMQNYMRERQVAMGLARQRELFYNWYSPFYGLVLLGCTLGYVSCRAASSVVFSFRYASKYISHIHSMLQSCQGEESQNISASRAIWLFVGLSVWHGRRKQNGPN